MEPDKIQRTYEIERDSINPETGSFNMILASEGEASDGHILSMRGGEVPDQIPLQISHENSPLSTLGSITQARVGTKQGLNILRALGQIEMQGEGPQAEIRRDVAHMIQRGHLTSMSLRAQGTKTVSRTELPKDHPAHVAPNEPNLMKRFGLLFQEWRALEGSIVALPADRNAIIGRAQETTGEVRQFWRSLVTVPVLDFDAVTDVRSLEKLLREVGASRSEAKRIIAFVKTDRRDDEPPHPPREAERSIVEPPDLSLAEVTQILRDELGGLKTEITNECADIVHTALGRVK